MNQSILKKCRKIKIVLTDVDGVLTDGSMYYSKHGEELKKFNTRDGMAVELLNNIGIPTIMITKEKSQISIKRAKKIKVKEIRSGILNKALELQKISKKYDISLSDFAYIGDDVNDLEAIKICGFSATPSDGHSDIKKIADYICETQGGSGAFRELTEKILLAKNNKQEELI